MASTTPSKPSSGGLQTTTIIAVVVVGILLIVGGIILGQATPLLFPQQASAEAAQVDNLFHIMLVIGGAIFLLVQGLLVFSMWRFRARKGETGDGEPIHGNTTLEIVWTAIPAVIVFVLTILSWQVFNSLQAPKPGEASVVVAGARFNWAFTYNVPLSILGYEVDETLLPPDVKDDLADDGTVSITSATLYSYVNQPVALAMDARDVIHAFWVPAFRVKQDLIPGRTTTVRFTPTVADTYPSGIQCAELCGANHGIMRADIVVAENEAEYNKLLTPILESRLFPPADPVVRGRAILESNVYPCYTCHVLSDLSSANWVGNVGPALDGVADRAATSRANATSQTAADYLYTAIHEPGAYLVPGYGNLMPQLGVPECDVWAMVAYLATQSTSGSAPFEVVQPEACIPQVSGPPGSQPPPAGEATAEAAAETEVVPAEATAEATAEGS